MIDRARRLRKLTDQIFDSSFSVVALGEKEILRLFNDCVCIAIQIPLQIPQRAIQIPARGSKRDFSACTLSGE